MKPRELRSGNYYLYKGVEIKFDISDFKEIDHNLLELLKPIQLTEDWLIKFGLQKHENHSPRYSYLNGFWDFEACYLYNTNGSFTLSTITYNHPEDEVEICTIEYVHQLQNIYYDLTDGKELVNETIKAHE